MRKKLKELRLQQELTQGEVANDVGITRSHYTKIENGSVNPSLGVAIKIKHRVNYFNDDLFAM
ncbi:MAG: helix-turn-helix transcriptional regulator [Paraclostridium sp.]